MRWLAGIGVSSGGPACPAFPAAPERRAALGPPFNTGTLQWAVCAPAVPDKQARGPGLTRRAGSADRAAPALGRGRLGLAVGAVD